MSIKPQFTPAGVAGAIQKKVDTINKEIERTLSRQGEKFVVNARNVNTYLDQSGNLRSSIVYGLYKDGRQIGIFIPGDKAEGIAAGKKALDEAARKHTKGYAMIVAAGMPYASALESGNRKKADGTYYSVVKKYDVLTNSSKIAEGDIKKALEQLTKNLKR